MSKWKTRWPQILGCVLALLTAGAMPPADAADAWDDGATPVFRHVEVPSDAPLTAGLQDREGLIWIGSQTGLASWDGYRYQNYVADPGVPGSLPSSWINVLHEDRKGQLWVGTEGGLARLDKGTGGFWTLGPGPHGLSNRRVLALTSDGADGLWVGTATGLDRLDLATRTVRRHDEGTMPSGLPVGRVGALLADRGGNLWVGAAEGLYVLRTGAHGFQPVRTESATGGAVEVRQLLEDKAGRIWIGTRTTGAFVIEPGTSMARQVHDSERSDGKGLEADWVAAIVDAGDDQVWLGTWTRGIVRVNTRTWATRRLRHDPDLASSLGSDDVTVLMRDRSGLVWAGGPSAFDSIDPAQRAVSTWYGTGGRLLGGSNAQVTSVLVRTDGSVWLGSESGGVDIVPPDRGPGRHLAPEDGQPKAALPKTGAVFSMADAPDGEVYIGTAKGLYRTRDGGRGVERMAFPGVEPTVLVRALCVAGNRLWIGGGAGLIYVDDSGHGVAAQRVAGFQGADVTNLNCLEDGSLWVGTMSGLMRYWPATGRIERPWPEVPGRVGLPSGVVTSVATDRRGRLWVAFYGGGVRVIEPGAGGAAARVHRIGREQGLQKNAANALLLDGQGNAWVSTDSGIVRIDRDTFAMTLLQQADGVGLLPYWTSAAGITRDGDLLFGGNGLTIVHPRAFQPLDFKAPLKLTDPAGRPISPAGLTLDPSQRALQITFALLDYTNPRHTRYAYRLAGLEDAWTNPPGDSRMARYTNVPAGHYTLEVRASNRSDQWAVLTSVPIHVLPAWYETISFRVIAAALLLALVGLLVQVRTTWLRRRAATLEALIAQRTRELQQRSDELVRRTAELQASEQRLEQLAYFDGLTGLANRRHFNDDLQQLVEQARRGTAFALVLLDLDRFKPINDAYGHDAGDAVLKAVGARLCLATRAVDLVSRLGGDEFAVLLRQPHSREAVDAVCERILSTIAQPIPYSGGSLEVNVSIGVAWCPQDAQDATVLYKAADAALYAAKEGGRGAWRWAGMPCEEEGSTR